MFQMFGKRACTIAPLRSLKAFEARLFSKDFKARMLSGCPALYSSKQHEKSGRSFQDKMMMYPLWSRGLASNTPEESGSGSKKGKGWLMAIGAAAFGFAGATYTYLQSHGQASCAEKCEEACVEKKCGDSDCLRKMDKEEEIIAKANSDLEKALKDVKSKALDYTEKALKAYCEASDLLQQFINKVYCAIEEDDIESPRFESVWCDVYDSAINRCGKVKEALKEGRCAWELICRLKETIANGRTCKYTQCNPLLTTAEESLVCAERELLTNKSKMECLHAESQLVEQYRNVVESFRRNLKAEIESLIPSDECLETYTVNECTMVLTHAYKKVLRIQKELAQVQECNQDAAASKRAEEKPKCPEDIKCAEEKPECPEDIKCAEEKPECPEDIKSAEEKPECPEDIKSAEEKPECPEDIKCAEEKPKCAEEKPKCPEEKPECPEDIKCAEEKPKCAEEKPKCSELKLKCFEEKPKCPEEIKCAEEKPKCAEEKPKGAEEKPKCYELKLKCFEEKPKCPEEIKCAEEKPKCAEEKPNCSELKK